MQKTFSTILAGLFACAILLHLPADVAAQKRNNKNSNRSSVNRGSSRSSASRSNRSSNSRSSANRSSSNRSSANRGSTNRSRSSVNRSSTNRSSVNRGSTNRGSTNRSSVNRSSSSRPSTVNRGSSVNRSSVNRSSQNKSSSNRTYRPSTNYRPSTSSNGSINRSSINRSPASNQNRSAANRSTINRSSATPNRSATNRSTTNRSTTQSKTQNRGSSGSIVLKPSNNSRTITSNNRGKKSPQNRSASSVQNRQPKSGSQRSTSPSTTARNKSTSQSGRPSSRTTSGSKKNNATRSITQRTNPSKKSNSNPQSRTNSGSKAKGNSSTRNSASRVSNRPPTLTVPGKASSSGGKSRTSQSRSTGSITNKSKSNKSKTNQSNTNNQKKDLHSERQKQMALDRLKNRQSNDKSLVLSNAGRKANATSPKSKNSTTNRPKLVGGGKSLSVSPNGRTITQSGSKSTRSTRKPNSSNRSVVSANPRRQSTDARGNSRNNSSLVLNNKQKKVTSVTSKSTRVGNRNVGNQNSGNRNSNSRTNQNSVNVVRNSRNTSVQSSRQNINQRISNSPGARITNNIVNRNISNNVVNRNINQARNANFRGPRNGPLYYQPGRNRGGFSRQSVALINYGYNSLRPYDFRRNSRSNIAVSFGTGGFGIGYSSFGRRSSFGISYNNFGRHGGFNRGFNRAFDPFWNCPSARLYARPNFGPAFGPSFAPYYAPRPIGGFSYAPYGGLGFGRGFGRTTVSFRRSFVNPYYCPNDFFYRNQCNLAPICGPVYPPSTCFANVLPTFSTIGFAISPSVVYDYSPLLVEDTLPSLGPIAEYDSGLGFSEDEIIEGLPIEGSPIEGSIVGSPIVEGPAFSSPTGSIIEGPIVSGPTAVSETLPIVPDVAAAKPPIDEGKLILNGEEDAASEPVDQIESYLVDAETSFKGKQYDDALKSLQHALLEQPKSGRIHLFVGQVFFAKGDYRNAIAAVYSGFANIEETTDWGFVIENNEGYYGDDEVYLEQLEALDEYIKKNDKAAYAFALRAYHRGFLGDPAGAREDLKKTMELEPRDEMATTLDKYFEAALKRGSEIEVLPAPKK